MNAEVRQWLESAEEDLATVKALLGNETTTGVAAFHCQQCVEKCLKAFT